MQRVTTTAVAAAMLAAVLTACSSIDCPLNNRVYAKFLVAGDESVLQDTLSVSTTRTGAEGNDTVLVNRLTATDSLAVPMSYSHDRDTYYFTLVQYGTSATVTDTVWVDKTNNPHFESVDCAPNMFHDITGVGSTHNSIDSITVNNNKVTYNDAKAHFRIYFKARRY